MPDKRQYKTNHELDALCNPIYIIRAEPIIEGEVLYDRHGAIAAIKSKGKLLEVLEGDL